MKPELQTTVPRWWTSCELLCTEGLDLIHTLGYLSTGTSIRWVFFTIGPAGVPGVPCQPNWGSPSLCSTTFIFKWVRIEILMWGNKWQICSIIREISSLHRPSRSNPQTHHYSSVCPMKVGSHALTHLDPEKMNFQWGLLLALFLPTTEHLTLAKHKDHNRATNFPDGRCLLNIQHHRNRFLTLSNTTVYIPSRFPHLRTSYASYAVSEAAH